MKRLLTLLLLAGCATSGQKAADDPFTGARGCLLVYDLKANSWVKQINADVCRERHPPYSTFKVPLAVMAFDAGILKGPQSSRKWDKKKRLLPAWNRDHTAASWMKESVVWFSQSLVRQMGRAKVQKYLDAFDYGNRDFSGDLTEAWLSALPGQTKGPKVSVAISSYEQITFLEKLWNGELPAHHRAQRLARDLTLLEKSPKGFTLYGKTGSGFHGKDNRLRRGWFVAWITKGAQSYAAVVMYEDTTPPPADAGYGGRHARALMLAELTKADLY